MNLMEFLAKLKALNIVIQLEAGNLKINAPKGSLTPGLIDELKSKKKEIIVFFQHAHKQTGFSALRPAEEKEYYPLSSMQKRLYFIQQMNPNSTGYNIPQVIFLGNLITITTIREVFQKIVARHEILKTSFLIVSGEPVQIIHKNLEFTIEYFETKEEPGIKEWQKVENIKYQFIKPFDLVEAPLFRVGCFKISEGSNILLIDMHHIITDGTSKEILKQEFYTLLAGKELPLPLQYKDFSEWQNSKDFRNKILKQEKYWLKELAGEIPLLNLSTDYPRSITPLSWGKMVNFFLDETETSAFKEIVRKHKVTLYIGLQAVFFVLLNKLSRQEDIIIGCPIAARPHVDLEKIIGMFVNTLAIRNFPVSEKKFSDFLHEVKACNIEASNNQEYPFEDLVDKVCVQRFAHRNPLFDVMFNLLNHSQYQRSISANDKKILRIHRKTNVKFDLNLRAIDLPDALLFNLEYSSQLFKKESINKIIEYFKNVITAVIRNHEQKISAIEIISQSRKKEILLEFCRDLRKTSTPGTMQSKLPESFRRYRHSIAIEYDSQNVSYCNLDRKSAIICNWLLSKGVREGSIIGGCLEDKVDLIVVMIGVFKARCVFMPIEVATPIQRIRQVIQNAAPTIVFTSPHHSAAFSNDWHNAPDKMEVFVINDSFYQKNNGLQMKNTPLLYNEEDSIYVYFSSGTTGIPNGFLGKNASLYHLIMWEIDTFGIDDNFHVSQLASVGFDAFLREVFIPLFVGGTICIPKQKELIFESEKLIKWIEQTDISLLHCVPCIFRLINSEKLTPGNFKNLKYVLLAGESINPYELKNWFETFNDRIQLVNLYGTSETTLFKTFHKIRQPDLQRINIPIGEPITGARIILLDNNLNLCDYGVVGEIYIRTPFSTLGYINNEALNRQHFILNPFNDAVDDILFKTGDEAVRTQDGHIEIIGRVDDQVKINGVRIELHEIETALLKLAEIKETVAVVGESVMGKNIAAFFVAEKAVEIKELRRFLLNILPPYMLPGQFIQIDKIPLTLNGKVDRDTLIARLENMEFHKSYEAPGNDLEKKLVDIWTQLLEVQDIGINDDFFQLGGNSLAAIKMVSEIYNHFNIEIPVLKLFQKTTIKDIAQYLFLLKVEKTEEEPIALLNKPGGQKIFMFPPAGGYGVNYNKLMPFLENVSMYAFNFIEEENRVEMYVELILKNQSKGPFILFGWSAGGHLAFEVAKRLEKDGHDVSGIILLDSLRYIEKSEGNIEIIEQNLQEIIGKNFHYLPEQLREKLRKKMLSYYLYISNTIDEGEINANIHLITAEDKSEDEILKRGWQKNTRKSYQIYKGSGPHALMLDKEFVQKNAEVITGILNLS